MNFRSKFEKSFSEKLTENKIEYEYETVKIKYTIPASIHTYTPDFILQKKKGGQMIIETKGRLKPADRKKLEMIISQNPDMDIRLVFQNPKIKIRKGSKTMYSDWANKVGIKWAEKEIPAEWKKECILLS